MGSTVPTVRLQVGLESLTALIASVVPDVSGIDKIFDYLVPETFASKVSLGARVRVVLNNRRVSGWVVRLETRSETTADGLSFDKLSPLIAVSGLGVEPDVIAVTHWAANEFFGSWRSMLSRASAPRVRERNAHPKRNVPPPIDDPVALAASTLADGGGGLLVIPPCMSALSAVHSLAQRGPVLVVCPTQRMAALGAASLRRRGLTTALAPEDWDAAKSGVNVVIGARSAVFSPCRDVSAIVVIDEHDELHHDERSPTWNSVDVAQERARQLGVPCILTSSIPSAESLHRHREATVEVTHQAGWPTVFIENLNELTVSGSLLSTSLLDSITASRGTTVCVLNTKGKARLVVCKSCRALQTCDNCGSALTIDSDDVLQCTRCSQDHGSVCVTCGRPSFSVPRGGVSHLVSQVQKSTRRPVVEVTADTDDNWTSGSVFIGTEAVLYRIPHADTVVFADIDRDLNAPRVTSAREVASLLVRAARVVGSDGRLVIQTRTPEHPLLKAISSIDPSQALGDWNESDVSTRKTFSFPPFGFLVQVSVADGNSFVEMPNLVPVKVAVRGDSALLSSDSRDDLSRAIVALRQTYGTSLRVHADPTRY